MGNSFGWKKQKTVKVMKINGETMKLQSPIRAGSLLESHPNHALLESESVKYFGVRAKPLEPQQELKPGRLYFLIELPKLPPDEIRGPRRVRSGGIQMSARERLESLMLARRSASDLTFVKNSSPISAAEEGVSGGVRVTMRLSKAEVDRLVAESKDGAEVESKILSLCLAKNAAGEIAPTPIQHFPPPKPPAGGTSRVRKVGFMPITQGEIQQLVVAA